MIEAIDPLSEQAFHMTESCDQIDDVVEARIAFLAPAIEQGRGALRPIMGEQQWQRSLRAIAQATMTVGDRNHVMANTERDAGGQLGTWPTGHWAALHEADRGDLVDQIQGIGSTLHQRGQLRYGIQSWMGSLAIKVSDKQVLQFRDLAWPQMVASYRGVIQNVRHRGVPDEDWLGRRINADMQWFGDLETND